MGYEYGGDGRGSFALEVLQPRYPSVATIAPSHKRIRIGEAVTLDLTLDTPSPPSREVTVTAVAADGSRTRVVRTDVGPGSTSVTVRPRRTTTYEVAYAGDDRASPAVDSTKVVVRSRVELTLVSDVLHKKGALYGRSGSTIWFSVNAHAFRVPECVYVEVDVRPAVDWHFYDPTVCVPLGRNGEVGVGLQSPRGKRPHLHRIAVRLASTPDNDYSRSRYHHVQFCRRTLPCKPPPPEFVGTTVLYGPLLRLVARRP